MIPQPTSTQIFLAGGVTDMRKGPSPAPYMPPFDMLFMNQIFATAVASFEERPHAVERLRASHG